MSSRFWSWIRRMDEAETFQVVDRYWKDIDPFWESSVLDYEDMYDYIVGNNPRLNRQSVRERLEHLAAKSRQET